MNYTKRGVLEKQQAFRSKSGKLGRKFVLSIVIILLAAIFTVAVWGVSAGLGMYKGILASTPRITSSQVAPVGAATFVYDSDGNKIDELVAQNANRIFVTMDQVPQHVAYAIVAAEDERFYEHNGIDYKSLIRAGYQFLKTLGDETQGASTITQQLLKNTIFTDWTSEGDNFIKKIKRKLQEQYLAVELTKILDKDEVLIRYMNTINLGQNTLGVEAAAQRYFGKSVSDLTISEAATIAVITQNPSKYNPISHPDRNAERRKSCLNTMLRLEFITQEEYDEAMADDVYSRIESHNINYLEDRTTSSYFVDALVYDVKADLLEAGYSEANVDVLVYSGGLRIMSTMDSDIQDIVDEVIADPTIYPEKVDWLLSYQLTITHEDGTYQHYSQEMMTKYFKENVDKDFDLLFSSQEEALKTMETYRNSLMVEGDEYTETYSITAQPQSSVVIMDQSTGYVVAMSGGRGTKEGRLTLNRATSTYRSPGSTFKVLAGYAPALDTAGLTLATVINDAPFNYDDGTPVNNWYSHTSTPYRGLFRLRQGIERSLNVVTVKLLTQISPRLGYEYIKDFGFSKITDHEVIGGKVFTDAKQPLALGGVTNGVSNEELTAAYASIANGGMYIKPKLYTKVLDSEGNVILDNTEPETRRVLQETTAYLLTDAMIDVVTASNGTGTSVNFRTMPIAGKTGTTTDNWDVWFAGYTPYYTCATWVGYDNNTKLKETNTARKIWRAIMEQVHAELPYKDFEVPEEGIVEATICSRSGKLPIAGVCDAHLMTELFAEGTVPIETCNVHYVGQICSYDNLPATAECPFQYPGGMELTPIEDESLWAGSTVAVEQPDGTIVYVEPRTSNICQHDAIFMANPDANYIINQQLNELIWRQQQAEAAAQAAQQDAANASG